MNKESKPIRKLFRYCRRYLPAAAAALFLGTAGAVFSVIGPDKIADMVNLIEQGIDGTVNIQEIGRIGRFLAILYGLGWLFGYIQNFSRLQSEVPVL